MKIILFYHSVISDWNHGNAHFLRGIATELLKRGHDVHILEPFDSWSYNNLIQNYGTGSVNDFFSFYPHLKSIRYKEEELDLKSLLSDADLVIVHEWNEHNIVKKIGNERRLNPYFKLLFHDTHHRSITDPESMSKYDLSNYDGVLAYGKVIKDIYIQNSWIDRVWVWHEAADTNVFHPVESNKSGDLVWIGNWGDEERSAEIMEFFIEPVRTIKIKASVYGVRYPEKVISDLKSAGIDYRGWLPNYLVPREFASYKLTVHIPRKPYVNVLTGIPTIRPFEALACGIPLITSPWVDSENLFTPGEDFLVANSGNEMKEYINEILNNTNLAHSLSQKGLSTIQKKHTCKHRVDELMEIYNELNNDVNPESIKYAKRVV